MSAAGSTVTSNNIGKRTGLMPAGFAVKSVVSLATSFWQLIMKAGTANAISQMDFLMFRGFLGLKWLKNKGLVSRRRLNGIRVPVGSTMDMDH